MRRKKQQSDFMSNKMDSELGRLEKDIASLYSNVQKEISADFQKFTDTFKKEYDANRIKVAEGVMTQEEFSLWTQRKTVQSDLYKSTIDSIGKTLVKADQAAMALVNGKLPSVVAQSYNFVQALGFSAAKKAGISAGTFQVYNARSVQALMKGDKNVLKPKVDVAEDTRWNHDKINKAITTSIVKGDSIPDVAKRLQGVTNMDRSSAVRNARTAMTSAENLGRSEAADDLKEKGIPVEEVWSATYDNRTRDTHLMLDGTVRDENGFFGADFLAHPLRYPADPEGDPEEIYNCRCRLNIQLKGIDHSNDEELYKQFMQENHPEDWENLQNNQHYQDMQAEKEAALDRKERLLNEQAEKQAEKADERIDIPEHPVRPRMKDYMDEDGYVDYDRLDSARAEYDKQMEEYNKIKDDYIKRYEETPSMSMPEFNKWCEDNNVDILPSGLQTFSGGTADVSEMDGRILTMATERCKELFSQFPYVLDYRQDFMERMGEKGTFHFSIGFAPKEQFVAEAGNGLVFGNNGGNIAEMAREHFEMVSTNGLVGGSGSLTSIIDHEFGHNVEEAIIEKNKLNSFEFEAECGRRLKGLEGSSEYSTTKDTERFAEAFSAYIGGEQTPFAKEMEKILKEQGMI